MRYAVNYSLDHGKTSAGHKMRRYMSITFATVEEAESWIDVNDNNLLDYTLLQIEPVVVIRRVLDIDTVS